MATDIYKLQVEAFLREISNEHRVIDLSNPLNTTGVNAPPTRILVPAIYDCFWRAGLALYRVVKRLTYEEVDKYCPSFLYSESISLTSGIATMPVGYEQVLDDAIAIKSGTSYVARKYSPSDALIYAGTTGKRKSPSLKHPKFEIKKASSGVTQILCYPLSEAFSSITIKGFQAPARLELSSSGIDTWNQAFSDLLVNGAVAIHKKGTGALGISQMYEAELNAKYGLFKQPKVNQNNSLMEQQK